MHVHFFQHDPMEGIGSFQDLLTERGWTVSSTLWDRGGIPPEPDAWDMLVVMGGPMNIYEDGKYPWLAKEKACLDQAIASGKPVLGVCLGAQLLADRLGSPVTRNAHSEIGWSELSTTPELRKPGGLLEHLPPVARVFQWHGDTFSLPAGAVSVGRTEACLNQGFVHGNVVALQFHLELAPEHLRGLIAAQESFEGPYVQPPEVFLADLDGFRHNREWLGGILDRIAAGAAGR
ncbi:MAG TPA: type 1 glutamine amidotransferase [Fibrobacteria bacterium]|nr:type 1 glutamine amidotransferase [Fibrobacteria bacterium]